MRWFRDAKFGMFVHWGVYSVRAKGEWTLYNDALDYGDYIADAYPKDSNYFDAKSYDPRLWAGIAKAAGMKYMVLTARHHDGFALFDSKFPGSITSEKTIGRDLVREYVEACRGAGLKVGLYYSLLSWRFPGYFDVTGTEARPNKFGIAAAAWHQENAREMKAELYQQVGELLTKYGRIDELWWDGGWLGLQGSDADAAYFWEPGRTRDPANQWAGDYGFKDRRGKPLGIMGMVRALQPHILANPRSGWPGDFLVEEGGGEITGPIRPQPWEKCLNLNQTTWGYNEEQNLMTADQIEKMLVDCVVRGGNMLLNVGPDRHGVIPPTHAGRLKEVGDWLETVGQSIYSTRPGPWDPVDNQVGFTQRGNAIYAHVLAGFSGNSLPLAKTRRRVAACRDLATGHKLKFDRHEDGSVTILDIRPDDPSGGYGRGDQALKVVGASLLQRSWGRRPRRRVSKRVGWENCFLNDRRSRRFHSPRRGAGV